MDMARFVRIPQSTGGRYAQATYCTTLADVSRQRADEETGEERDYFLSSAERWTFLAQWWRTREMQFAEAS